MGRRKKRKRNAPKRQGPGHTAKTDSASTDRLRPWLLGAMTALFVVRPLYPSESVAVEGDGLPVVMLWIALAVFWTLGLIGRAEFRLRFGFVDAAVLILIMLHTLAGIWAVTNASPRPAVNMLWEWIGMGVAFFLARQFIVGRRETRAIVVVMIALAVGLSGYGLYQYFHEIPSDLTEYDANEDTALREAGQWCPPDSPQRKRFRDRLASMEPFATFALNNSLAGYLVPWLVVGVGVAVGSRLGRKWLLVCLVPIAVCLFLTKSRTGYLAAAFGLVLVWLFCRGGARRFGWKLPAAAAGVGAILVAVALVAGGLDRDLLAGAPKSVLYRVQYWQSTAQMIADKPLLGCGPGNFKYAYTQYKLPEASEEVSDPHNFLFEVCGTAGVPALAALLAVLGGFAWVSWRFLFLRSDDVAGTGVLHGRGGTGVSPVHGQDARGTPASSSADEPNFVYGGAICGFLLAIPLGMMSAGSPSTVAVPLTLVLAAGCLWMLRAWGDEGQMPDALPAIGVAVLLLNLLAAGAMGYPAVAGTLWLLMALGLNLVDGSRWRVLRRGIAMCGLTILLTLAVTCYLTAYNPVLSSQGSLRMGTEARLQVPPELLKAYKYFGDAAIADPLDVRPVHMLAETTLSIWQGARDSGRKDLFQRFEDCTETTVGLAPNRSDMWRMGGDWYQRAFEITDQPEYLDKAIDYYSRAVDLYPNSGLCHAKLALALYQAGREDAFRREAAEAIRLDDLTPHEDKKLDKELREELLRRQG